jgi:predicted amidohydrolase
MKIALAQTKPLKGNIPANIEAHKRVIDLAIANGANMVIFPELSITGYEPELAKELATSQEDSRFDDFQEISDINQITIGIGMPIKTETAPRIGMIIFQSHQSRQVYAKQYLHDDELPYFVQGNHQVYLAAGGSKIGLGICYELSVPAHVASVHANGAQIYLTSVAKTVSGVEKAIQTLSATATQYAMTVFMVNCIGLCEGVECGGRSSIWNTSGQLIGQLDAESEGILMLDTGTGEVISEYGE